MMTQALTSFSANDTAGRMTKCPHMPLVLIILDGWGERAELAHNGIALANTPFYDALLQTYSHTLIAASGPAVGLPEGIMGNSEVGHMNMGAGRVVYSGLSQIYQAIETGDFFKNEAYLKAIEAVKTSHGTLHLMGLLSDGAVHSHQDHLYALLKLAKQEGVLKVAIHAFMDGRDTSPQDGLAYLEKLEEQIKSFGVGTVASVSGRYYAMDRDNRWERVAVAFEAIVGKSANVCTDWRAYMTQAYAQGLGDEFIIPCCVRQADGSLISLTQNDAVIFFNFRADRAKEITLALTEPDFTGFDRKGQALPAVYVGNSVYDRRIKADAAFIPSYPTRVLGEILAEQGLTQLRLAETEKYAHVTFFFNGGQDTVFPGEDRVLVPSPKEVATYDLKPEMSAFKVCDELLADLQAKKHAVIIVNFANGDMVGHTAKPEAIIKAVEVIDACLAQIIPVLLAQGGVALITADHGNAEEMLDQQGRPLTAHTTNLVPFVLVSQERAAVTLKSGGRLCDVAPTILQLLNLPKPAEMTGVSLLG